MGHLCGSQRTPLPLLRVAPNFIKRGRELMFYTSAGHGGHFCHYSPPQKAHEGFPEDRLASSTALISSIVVVSSV